MCHLRLRFCQLTDIVCVSHNYILTHVGYVKVSMDGGLSKPSPRVQMQRATCPRLLRDRLRPAGLEPRPRDR